MGAHAKPVSMKVIVAAVFVAGWMVLVALASRVNVPSPGGPPRARFGGRAAPSLVITRTERLPADDALREQLYLLDPGPLFMPARESGSEEMTEAGRDGRSVEEFAPALRFFSDTAPARGILRPAAPASAEAAAQALAEPRWFRGLARVDEAASVTANAARAARVDVYLVGTAERVAAVDVAKVSGLDDVAWRPLMFSVLVNEAGSLAPPVVVVSSGVDEVDERFRSIVGRELLPTLLLRPGIYRLEVGP